MGVLVSKPIYDYALFILKHWVATTPLVSMAPFFTLNMFVKTGKNYAKLITYYINGPKMIFPLTILPNIYLFTIQKGAHVPTMSQTASHVWSHLPGPDRTA